MSEYVRRTASGLLDALGRGLWQQQAARPIGQPYQQEYMFQGGFNPYDGMGQFQPQGFPMPPGPMLVGPQQAADFQGPPLPPPSMMPPAQSNFATPFSPSPDAFNGPMPSGHASATGMNPHSPAFVPQNTVGGKGISLVDALPKGQDKGGQSQNDAKGSQGNGKGVPPGLFSTKGSPQQPGPFIRSRHNVHVARMAYV